MKISRLLKFIIILLFQVEYLLYELREPILLAACSMTLSSELKVKMASYVDIYIMLASVCDRFYEMVRDRRFKRTMRRYLRGVFLELSSFIVGVLLYLCKHLITSLSSCRLVHVPCFVTLCLGRLHYVLHIKYPPSITHHNGATMFIRNNAT